MTKDKPQKNNQKNKNKMKIKVFTKKKNLLTSDDVVIEKLKSQYETIDESSLLKFLDLPLTTKTIKGLKDSQYVRLTDIQKAAIGLALQGKDILGAAQTGSGKTLAFLIPILEKLFCEKWSRLDGLGSIVITPTRELAYQIFETLRKVGKYHDFSAGLIIGGKDLKFERKRMDQCNIVICTPGRLLHHMDENPIFDCSNMKILVLDEADRCLDMGFKETMNAIIGNLPPKRQTLLFSATQTKSVQDLARLSLKDPSYVSVHEMTTPKELSQSYVVCELHEKVSLIWSFIRNHLKQKIIIFFSTCKQVKYFYEIFCKLRPGLSLMALYGTLHQLRRMKIYEDFCNKQSAVLFATDLAARGLDFPKVNWVVQADCPEDVETYIHRVGRTARYHRGGESLLLLMPSELNMIQYLEEKKIPIEKIEINPSKLQNPIKKMEAFLAKDSTLKDTAQRAFSNYAKAVFFMKHKDIFNVQSLDFASYANSLGLAIAPRIRFLDRMNKKQQMQNSEVIQLKTETKDKIYFNDKESDSEESSTDTQEKEKECKPQVRSLNIQSNVPQQKEINHQKFNFDVSNSEDEEDDVFKIKRRDHDIDLSIKPEPIENILGANKKKKPITKAAAVKKILKKNILPNKKVLFDDSGAHVVQGVKEKQSELAREYENEDASGIDIEKAKLVLKEEDKYDKQVFKERVKAKHKEQKRKLKEMKKREEEDEQDDFGESEDDEGPDLSWLPDPDKIYNKKYNSKDDDSVEVTGIKKKNKDKNNKKRKSDLSGNVEGLSKSKRKRKAEQISENLDVNETEELALMLLKGKK